MSSLDRILETTDDQAAISRFFYNLEPIDPVLHAGSGLFDYSRGFAERYDNDLRHRLSLIAAKAIDGEGNSQDIDNKQPDFDHRATIMAAFDKMWAEQGMYGWQINLTKLAPDLLAPRPGRVVIGVYCSAQAEHTLIRKFDGQGREVATAARQSSDPRVSAVIARTLLYPMLEATGVADASARLDKERGDLAQRIVAFDQTHVDSAMNLRQRVSMERQLGNIAFPEVNFRLDASIVTGQLARRD